MYIGYYSRVSVTLSDQNLCVPQTPVNIGVYSLGSVKINLVDGNVYVCSPYTSDWYTPSDVNIHIVDATNFPPQYFLITDLNDVAGGGKIKVICDFNTAITPEECATLYVRKP